ncbi:hypothetical protein BN3662_03226 [Clostridiales bacterium CHKCI006]|uniref:Uncharacterized protein n=1 Tax=Candidatus Fimiplasma intestinipullorum TaxID=2840825 RepID=A0A9D1L1S1_9FIRM|nr:hypothetical protein BN3662_03226 [Clostridiales bacterium CHKCI006]HIU14277.1 hypothetical protein [Candidatus Fimiplasma intestinipullorum]
MKRTNGFILLEAILALSLLVTCLVFLFRAAVQIHVSYQEVKQREMALISSWLE